MSYVRQKTRFYRVKDSIVLGCLLQAQLLQLIREGGCESVLAYANELFLNYMTVSRHLQKLVKKGILEEHRGGPYRAKTYTIIDGEFK